MNQGPSEKPQTLYLKDYMPPSYFIEKVDLHFSLEEPHTLVTATSEVRRNKEVAEADAPLVLDGINLKIVQVRVNEEVVSYEQGDESLTLKDLPESFQLEVITSVKPQENKALEGLYKSSGMYCTQCEAQGFRRITYFIDRPDNMAIYTTTITADKEKYPYLLSNGDLVEKKDLKDGRHMASWRDPYKKPSYLFALVAGDLDMVEDEFVTKSGRKVSLQIFVNKGKADRCGFALEALKKSMLWDEVRYGLEYDLDTYMIVAVDDFNMGAMENKGLNVFNSKYVLASPETATDQLFETVESIIGHEYFHNWTGNRITCRDWFQLSLKEGLTVYRDQEFTEDHYSQPVKRIEDVRSLREGQFVEDAGPNAHPVRPASAISIDNFYTATVYNKGAEVVRMIEELVGLEGFHKGIEKYIELFDGQAVTTVDFVKAMELANDIDLTQFKRWYDQAGTPVIKVQGDYNSEEKTFTLTMKQSCPPTKGQSEKLPFHIPIKMGLLSRDGKDLDLQLKEGLACRSDNNALVLELKEPQQTFVFSDVQEKPTPSLLRDFSAPVKLEYAYTDKELNHLMVNDSNFFNRWEAGQKLYQKQLIQICKDLKEDRPPKFDALLVEAVAKNIEGSHEDRLFASTLLGLPSQRYLEQFFDVIHPDVIYYSRKNLKEHLAKECESQFLKIYNDNQSEGPYHFDLPNMGKRSIKNTCLSYLVNTGKEEYLDLALKQYQSANNMTDTVGAMEALRDREVKQRNEAYFDFYEKWKEDSVVYNTWLSLESTTAWPHIMDFIKKAMQDPNFNINTPNNVFASLRTFAFQNPVGFHRPDGKAYEFLADHIIDIDQRNPQVAATLAEAFSQWQKYEEGRKALMKEQLEKISQTKGLSRNTYEIVSRALS